jgi:hypothetical protein
MNAQKHNRVVFWLGAATILIVGVAALLPANPPVDTVLSGFAVPRSDASQPSARRSGAWSADVDDAYSPTRVVPWFDEAMAKLASPDGLSLGEMEQLEGKLASAIEHDPRIRRALLARMSLALDRLDGLAIPYLERAFLGSEEGQKELAGLYRDRLSRPGDRADFLVMQGANMLREHLEPQVRSDLLQKSLATLRTRDDFSRYSPALEVIKRAMGEADLAITDTQRMEIADALMRRIATAEPGTTEFFFLNQTLLRALPRADAARYALDLLENRKDEQALRAVEEAFRAGWLDFDESQRLRLAQILKQYG